MLKQFLKNSSIYTISNLLSRGVALIMVPFYTRVLTPADYGIIDFIAIVAVMAGTLFPMEITQAVGRFYPEAKTPSEKRDIASNSLLFSIAMLGLFLLVVQFIAEPFGNWLYEKEDPYAWSVVRAAGVSIFTNKIFYVVQSLLQAKIAPKKHAIASILYSAITLSLNVVFILIMKTGVIGIFWAQSIGSVIAGCLSFYFSRESYAFTFNGAKFRDMLRFSLPLVPSTVGLFFLTYIDRLFIKGMLSLDELGLYGIGFRLASIIGVLMGGMTSALTPMIYSALSDEKTPLELARIFRFFLFAAIILTGALSIFSAEALMILTPPEYAGAASVVPALVVSTFLAQMYIFTPGLGIVKKTGHLATINVIGGVLNVGFNWLLIHWLGILGTALATMFSYLLTFSVKMHYSQKFYPVPHDGYRLIGSLLIATPIVIAGFLTHFDSIWSTLGLKSLLFISLPLVLIANRLVAPAELKEYGARILAKVKPA